MWTKGILRALLWLAAGALAACAAQPSAPAPEHSRPPQAPDPAELGWRELSGPAPWQDVLPLTVGSAWTYQVERVDECKARGATKEIEGTVAETIVAAWEAQPGSYVFEVRVESQLFRQAITRTYYLVLIGDTLYQSLGSPLPLLRAGGKGFESAALMRKSLDVGDALGAAGEGWRALAREPVVWAGGTAEGCLRLQQQTSREVRVAWFCPGIGFVKRHTVHIGESINEQWQTLIALRVPR